MGTPNNVHQDIALVLGAALYQHLRGQQCKARLAAPLCTVSREVHRERSPDIVVTFDEQDLAPGTRVNFRPKLIIEIVSPNEGDDLKDKLDEYQAIETSEEYIAIETMKRSVRRLYKAANGKFQFDLYYIFGLVRLASIGYTLNIDVLYDEVGIA